MRRAILLGSVMPIVVMAVLAFTETVLLAQTPNADSFKPVPMGAPAQLIPKPNPLAGPDPRPRNTDPRNQRDTFVVSPPTVDASPLRQRFIELSKKKAQALTEEQLKHEVEGMEAEVRELEAWAKAHEAVRLLHEVIEKHPNTKAADTANAAIQLIERGRNQSNDRPRAVPTPGKFDRPPTDDFTPPPQPFGQSSS